MTDQDTTTRRIRRSLERAGPLGVALILGVVLVATSALSYRDARVVAGVVAERQGIGLLHRVETAVAIGARAGDPGALGRALKAALEANRGLDLTYVGLLAEAHPEAQPAAPGEGGPRREAFSAFAVEVGRPLLGDTAPAVGSPAFGHGRVRMVSPGARPHPPGEGAGDGPDRGAGPRSPGCGDRLDSPCPPVPDFGKPTEPASADRGPPGGAAELRHGGPHHRPLVIEFEPIGSDEAIRRALVMLLLSAGAAGLLTAAAVILSTKARRAERAEAALLAQRHLARLGEMSAVLAHEIRNPLAALKGHAQLLAERVADPEVASRVNRVVTEAVRLEKLTTDLLEFARVGAISVGPVSPAALLEGAARATEPDRIDRDGSGAPPSFDLDGARIEQVLINLLENALAVTPAGAKVEARAAFERGALVLSVRDRGPGVPAAERARIFEPFHTTKTRGTGLGLSVARRIVELHGGHIDIVDAAGGGAVFRVTLPRVPAPPPGASRWQVREST